MRGGGGAVWGRVQHGAPAQAGGREGAGQDRAAADGVQGASPSPPAAPAASQACKEGDTESKCTSLAMHRIT